MPECSPIRVLVVDDEPSIRESLTEFLGDFSFEVSSVASGEEALAVLESAPCDVAIVDLRLPGMGSDSLILQVHEIRPDVRFLIHTGSLDYRLTDELEEIGLRPEHVFFKPQLDLTPFVEAIRKQAEREA